MESNFKILVVGDPGVGKTSMITRHKFGKFESTYIRCKCSNFKMGYY